MVNNYRQLKTITIQKSHLNNSLAFAGSLLRWVIGIKSNKGNGYSKSVFLFGHQKTRISLFAYPLSEVLRKPKVSNKQCRNPRCVYVYTRAYLNRGTHGCIIHPMSIYYCLVFEDFLLKFLRFQKVKNKR